MPVSDKRIRAVDDERCRLTYIESPLVVPFSPSKKTSSEEKTKTTNLKSKRDRDTRPASSHPCKQASLINRNVSQVTPSPQSLPLVGNSQSGIPRSTSGKRQLMFTSPKPSSESCDHAEVPRLSPPSLSPRSLFRSKNRHPSLVRLQTEDHSQGDSHSRARRSRKKGDYSSVPYGMTSWDSLASVASIIPPSPNKNKQSTKEVPSPTLQQRRKRNDDNSAKLGHGNNSGNIHRQSHSANSIPLELVSLLLPAGLKSTKRLPLTHEEVIKKVAAHRRKQFPLRTKLPRNCKANRSVYTEESDDDLYFDTLLHHDNIHDPSSKTTLPVPREVITHSETAASLLADSTPTDTNTLPPAPQHRPGQGADIPSPRRGRSCKVQPSGPCGTDLPIRRKRGRPSNRSSLEDDKPRATEHATTDYPIRSKRQKLSSPSPMKAVTTGNSQPLPVPNTRSQARREARISASIPKSPLANSDAHAPEKHSTTKDVDERPERPKTRPSQANTMNMAHRSKGTRNHHGAPPQQQIDVIPKKTVPTAPPVRPIVKVQTITKSSNNSATKRHKVRFAPTTTTFSLKIQVKTSSSPTSKKNRNISAPTLSESTVQSIANQITQAYLAQSPGARVVEQGGQHSPSQGDGHSEEDEPNVEDSDSIVTTGSSDEMDSDSVQENDEMEEQIQHDTCSNNDNDEHGTASNNNDQDDDDDNNNNNNEDDDNNLTFKSPHQQANEIIVAKDNIDSRSVASEITMDIDLLRGAKNTHSKYWKTTGKYKNDQVSNHDDASVESLFAMPPCDGDETREEYQEHLPFDIRQAEQQSVDTNHRRRDPSCSNRKTNEKCLPLENNGKRKYHNISHGLVLATGSTTNDAGVENKKSASPKHKQRRLTSTDSLAGESLMSIYSIKSANHHFPTEVAVNRRRESTSSSSPPKVMNHNLGDQKRSKSSSSLPTKQHDGNIVAEGSVNDGGDVDETVVTDKSIESRRATPLGKQCGKCSGCKQLFDCLTCSKCISSLQEGKCRYGQGTGCLKRICKRRAYQIPMDTLCRTTTSSTPFDFSQNAPPVLEREVDDTSRRSFSETGSVFSTASKMRRSRAARLWSRRWSTQDKQHTPTNTTTTSSSIASGSEKADGIARKGRSGGTRNKKQRKSELHDLELPMPTDGSVASILERRRSLHALMEYDEADQDWL